MPLSRRRQLLDWAARSGVVVVEDDYDSELRHTGAPLPALAALDDPVDGSVVLLGTFSKTVSQALAAGFLLAPAGLRARIEPVRADLGGPVPAVVQSALAAYLGSGELRRHTARMRRRYAARRELVLELLHGLPGARVRPMSGGLHAVVQLEARPGAGAGDAAELERRVLAASDAADLGAIPLSAYWQRRGPGGELFGLVIGTGGRSGDEEFERAVRALRAILRDELVV
ncbi:aminotransferase class I/II-fold pyridoxal phosphate-dependent enzyme [Leucobacter soli]|uniref:aminotransferase class I/II-fold pyridoxal phosphate-dependent enzyme n=1 Tax=Leucobacter soli TaxID=2812850 RepID=UPI00360C5E63